MPPSFHGNNGIGFSPAIQRIITSTPDSRIPYKYDARSQSPGYTNGRPPYEPPYKRIASSEELEKHIALTQPWANIKIRSTSGRGMDILGHLCTVRRNAVNLVLAAIFAAQ